MQPNDTRPLCERCGVPVRSKPNKDRPRRFCSQACKGSAAKVLPPTQCAACGKTMNPGRPSRPRQFCNRTCRFQEVHPLAVRFWAKVNKDGPVIRPELGPCWMWTGARQFGGYGVIGLGRRGEGQIRATHASLEIHGTPLTAGLDALHHCDNPPCVRPSHLFEGTTLDNALDAQAKGRLVGAGKGEKNHRTTLTDDDVRMIRSRHAEGESRASISRDYAISAAGIWYVVRRITWKHVV